MSKRGYSLERFQSAHQTITVPVDVVPGTPVDLKSAAGTILATWYVPNYDPGVDSVYVAPLLIRVMGAYMAAAGGAQTTAGTAGLYLNGTLIVDTAAGNLLITSVVTHAIGTSIATLMNLTPSTSNFTTPPSYQVVEPGDVITMRVVTQGVGAGSQTIYPWLTFTEAAGVQQ